jgi:hypothetical protein
MLRPSLKLRPDGTHRHLLEYRVEDGEGFAWCTCCGACGPVELTDQPCTFCGRFGHGAQEGRA